MFLVGSTGQLPLGREVEFPSLKKIIVLKYPVFLKPLAALLADWTRELSPSRNELVDPFFHQFKIPSRSCLRVPAILLILATTECIIHKQSRSGALAVDSLSGQP